MVRDVSLRNVMCTRKTPVACPKRRSKVSSLQKGSVKKNVEILSVIISSIFPVKLFMYFHRVVPIVQSSVPKLHLFRI